MARRGHPAWRHSRGPVRATETGHAAEPVIAAGVPRLIASWLLETLIVTAHRDSDLGRRSPKRTGPPRKWSSRRPPLSLLDTIKVCDKVMLKMKVTHGLGEATVIQVR